MAVLLASVAALMAPVATAPLKTTLCAVLERPQAFTGKIVRFRAGVMTDWQHGTVLVHEGCKRGIELTSSDAATPVQSKALDRAVGNPLDGGPDRTAMATFTGRFSLRVVQAQDGFDNRLKFQAERIENIVVYRRKQSR